MEDEFIQEKKVEAIEKNNAGVSNVFGVPQQNTKLDDVDNTIGEVPSKSMVEPGVSFAFDASKIKKQEEEEAHALDKEKYKWLFRYNS